MGITTTNNIKKKVTKESADNRYPAWMGEERVKVYIDSNGSDQPIVGCINGYNWIVPTGEEVEIPTCIYDIIKDVRRMKVEADKAAKEFLDGAKKLD